MATDKDQNEFEFSSLSLPLMTPEEAAVWEALRHRCGKAASILGPELEARTGIRYKQIQKIISGLICHHHKLIGSGTCGYWIPVTPAEVADAAHYLRHRAIVALHRAAEMQRTSIEDVFGQAKMEFEKVG